MNRLAILTLAAAGCSALDTPGTTRPLYLLTPQPPATAAAPADAPSVRVRSFTVDAGFAGFDLVWRRNGVWQVDAYHGWLARPGEMLADASVAWLTTSGVFSRVQRDGFSMPADRTLEASVTRLAADLDAKPPCAMLAIRFYLTGTGVQPLVVDTEASEPMKASTAEAAVEAWNAALSRCLASFADAARKGAPTR